MSRGTKFSELARSRRATYISIYPDDKIWRKMESPEDRVSTFRDDYGSMIAYFAFDDADLFEDLLDYTCNVYEISALGIYIVEVDADKGENTVFYLQDSNDR